MRHSFLLPIPSPRTSAFACSIALAALLVTGCHSSHSTSLESYSDSGQSFTGSSDGTLNVNKMGGDIHVLDAPGGASLRTMGGSIIVDKAEKSLDITTMGGNVIVHSANVSSLKASSMGGNIDISATQASDLHADTAGGNITVQTLADGSINLKSLGGSIALTIPRNSSTQVDVELAYTMGSSQHYSVTSNLGLQQQQTSSWDLAHGNPRKYIYAKGTVGGGKNHIVIKTIDGNVTLNAQ